MNSLILRGHSYAPMPEGEISEVADFSHLRYVRGYYLTDLPSPKLGGHWRECQLGSYTLGWDQRTPSASASDGIRTVYLIGRAFHLAGGTGELKVLADRLLGAALRGRDNYNAELYELTGRYVVIDSGPECIYLQTDASGMRSAYYSKTGGTVSSHAGLTAQIVGDDSPSPFGVEKWFSTAKASAHPGRATEYAAVLALTPNTELEVASATISRVGPLQRGEKRSVESVAEEMVPLVQSYFRWLVENENVLLSLTAGIDSRTSLALSRPVSNRITYFSYATYPNGKSGPSQADMLEARRICEDNGLRFQQVIVDEMLRGGPLNRVIRGNSRRIHAPSIAAAYRKQLSPDSVHIRSNVYEIGRAFFRHSNPRHVLPELTATEFAQRGIKAKDHETLPAATEAFEDWMTVTGFSEVRGGYDPYDLYYWELRMGRWLSAPITESDISHDTLTVVNSRRVLELMLSVPYEDRLSARLFDELIVRTWPELFGYPFNGEMRSPYGTDPK